MARENYVSTKTLWFEFLLSPNLLEKHLSQENPDPSPAELIVHFLTNSATSTWTGNGEQDHVGNHPQGSFPPPLQPVKLEVGVEERTSKRKVALKLLALKVGAFLRWDLDELEKSLPVTMQYLLLNELIKQCDKSPGSSCSLFSYILYYRWILRSLMKVSYPVRGQKGFSMPIPLLQQIDPTFIPHETMENLVKKLHELSSSAVAGLEKLVSEFDNKVIGNSINIPVVECFTGFGENNQNIACDWSRLEVLQASAIVDVLRYELGRWFFFNENYLKAKNYWEGVPASKRDGFLSFQDYLLTASAMIDDTTSVAYEVQIPQEYFKSCVDKIAEGNSCDMSAIERKLELKVISNELGSARLRYDSKPACKAVARKLSLYLCSKINGLKELSSEGDDEETDGVSKNLESSIQQMAVEEGEIDAEEEVEKDPEQQLLEATDPEVIQNLATKVHNLPLVINKRWEIPRTHSLCLQNLQKPQYCKCHIVLAKAAELRRAKMYLESRTLYLSLLEDIQASLPNLANLITLELLQTDLEYHFDTNDIDERRNLELLAKCERALRNEGALYQFSCYVIDLCCTFILEAGAPFIKDFLNSLNPVLKLSACLRCVAHDASALNNGRQKELWEFLLSAVCKRPQQFASAIPLPSLLTFINRLKSPIYVSTMISCLIRIHNVVRDNQHMELSLSFPAFQWPSTLGTSVNNVSLQSISILLQALIEKGLTLKPNEITLLRCKAELYLIEGKFGDALRTYILLLMIVTEYFTAFGNYCDEEIIIQCMIKCSTGLECFTQAAVLHQMTREPNYTNIFMALNERSCNDSCDDLYDCFWDVTVLEYLINMHTRRGEVDRRNKSIQMIGQLELNANNTDDICKEAANVRRGKFFRMLAKKYL